MWHIHCDYLSHIYCDYLSHTTFHFYLINFQLNTDFPSQFWDFYSKKNHIVLLKDRFLKKMLLKRAKNLSPFFHKTIGSNNSFTLKFQVFKIAKLWIQDNSSLQPMDKMHPRCDPLSKGTLFKTHFYITPNFLVHLGPAFSGPVNKYIWEQFANCNFHTLHYRLWDHAITAVSLSKTAVSQDQAYWSQESNVPCWFNSGSINRGWHTVKARRISV